MLRSLVVVLYLQYTAGDQSDLREINTASYSYCHGNLGFLYVFQISASAMTNESASETSDVDVGSDNIPPTNIVPNSASQTKNLSVTETRVRGIFSTEHF